jgi:hypothetical protein
MNDLLRQVIAEIKKTPDRRLPPPKKPRRKSPPKPPTTRTPEQEKAHQESLVRRRQRYAERTKDRPRKLNPDNVQIHGTTNSYQRWKCRCEMCREAYAKAGKRRRLERYAEYKASNYAGVTHGTLFGYNQAGCRCEPCRKAVLANKVERYRKTPIEVKRAKRKAQTREQKDRRNELARERRRKAKNG